MSYKLKMSAIALAGACSFFGCSDGWDKGLLKCSNETALSTINSQYEEYARNLVSRIQKSVPESEAKTWRESNVNVQAQKRVAKAYGLPRGATYSTGLTETKLQYKDFLTTAMNKDIRSRQCVAKVSGTLSLGQYGTIEFSDKDIEYTVQPSDDDKNVWTWFQVK